MAITILLLIIIIINIMIIMVTMIIVINIIVLINAYIIVPRWTPRSVLKNPNRSTLRALGRLKSLNRQGDNGCPCEFSWMITGLKPEFA